MRRTRRCVASRLCSNRRVLALSALTVLISTLSGMTPAFAAKDSAASDAGRVWKPTVLSEPLYQILDPTDVDADGAIGPDGQPVDQRFLVRGEGDNKLFVEVWLPVDDQGRLPGRVPTILDPTPYMWSARAGDGPGAGKNYRRSHLRPLIDYAVPRGYAYAQMHLRGTGESTGCFNFRGPVDVADMARVIQHIGQQPWSNEAIAAIGPSYDGGAVVAAAGGNHPAITKYLKAIVPIMADSSHYAYRGFDGVPYTAHNQFYENYYGAWHAGVPEDELPTSDGWLGENSQGRVHVAEERTACTEDDRLRAIDQADESGNFSEWDAVREHRLNAGNVTAATLYVQGLQDVNVKPDTMVGFFDQLPSTTPRAAILGQWGHEMPDQLSDSNTNDGNGRGDFNAIVTSWFDRYLKGLDTGVESWPTVQVQGTDGQWRGEVDFPATGGPVGQLALGPDGSLGVTTPDGASNYVESLAPAVPGQPDVPGTHVTFTTPPLSERLAITGQPILDLWVTLDRPDAHLAAELQAFDEDHEAMRLGRAVGYRSMQHLDPFVNNLFVQPEVRLPAINEPVHVYLRFMPMDMVVPEGGYLRLNIAGSQIYGTWDDVFRPSAASGTATRVSVLHDCDHPSVLRFLMPRADADLLNVLEMGATEDSEPLHANPGVSPPTTGGGMATAPVCGRAPERIDLLGPEKEYTSPGGGVTRPEHGKP